MIMRHLLEPDLSPREACPNTGNQFPALQSVQHSSTMFNSVSFERLGIQADCDIFGRVVRGWDLQYAKRF